MSIIGDILGGAAAAPIQALGDTVGKLFTSDDERLTHAEVMERIKQNPDLWQAETNKIEAANTNWFVAGWRPAIGWVCAVALGCFYIPQFLIGSFLWAKITIHTGAFAAYPISASDLMALVGSLLGMATLRSVETIKGVARK